MEDNLNIQSNAALENVDGLQKYAIVQLFFLFSLLFFSLLFSITSVGGYLRIYDNYALTNVDGLLR